MNSVPNREGLYEDRRGCMDGLRYARHTHHRMRQMRRTRQVTVAHLSTEPESLHCSCLVPFQCYNRLDGECQHGWIDQAGCSMNNLDSRIEGGKTNTVKYRRMIQTQGQGRSPARPRKKRVVSEVDRRASDGSYGLSLDRDGSLAWRLVRWDCVQLWK
ncbi:hypothetical protein P168DRAFT_288211 [Aspergillus campestris IBT 28561]|uniref:Uncharacterized protein n=1 Tax=Aspergillus campestris (strain IBT 28561) TaxID=1392248 RepID=A0A2I1D8R3_ASPC2|nr:uncharacterized protein P168DRAFT_288211 [Aspergillus campestris IBT 28561]PKY06264.1 hypothetical protein P168DRAFT_288211 [Aspergillus campestris IBT 28561]